MSYHAHIFLCALCGARTRRVLPGPPDRKTRYCSECLQNHWKNAFALEQWITTGHWDAAPPTSEMFQ